MAVIGGGATVLGVALDAAARGFEVALVEATDFAKGTSSRSTKLIHGGVRYQAQGNIALVREALHERGVLLANAPHLAQPLAFVMPGYSWWERGFYGAGLKAYDALAGSRGLGSTQLLSTAQVEALIPTVRTRGLSGGVKYWTGQFDDARLAVTLARTAVARGACVVNHMRCVNLHRDAGTVCGLVAEDAESGERFTLSANCVVNATGVWVDAVRDMDAEPGTPKRLPMVAPSQGVHLVVDRSFLPTDHALLISKTDDGRVIFAVPWLGKTVLGTTDTPRIDTAAEPSPFRDEVEFILREASKYLSKQPMRATCSRSGSGCGRWFARRKPKTARRKRRCCRASTRCGSADRASSRLPAASGRPTGRWPRRAEPMLRRRIAEGARRRCHRAPAARRCAGRRGKIVAAIAHPGTERARLRHRSRNVARFAWRRPLAVA